MLGLSILEELAGVDLGDAERAVLAGTAGAPFSKCRGLGKTSKFSLKLRLDVVLPPKSPAPPSLSAPGCGPTRAPA